MWEGDEVLDDNPFVKGSFQPPDQNKHSKPESLSIMADEGFVYADLLQNGKTQVTHVPMQITKAIEGKWEVVFGPDSQQACICKQDDAQTLQLASELFEWDLYKHDTTGERFMEGHAGGKHAGKQTSLDQQLCMHMEADIIVTVMSSVETVLPVSVFQRPRDYKSRVFWSMPHVYEFMGLQCYGGQSSKWVQRGKRPWQTSLNAALGDGDAFIHSVHGNVGESVVECPVYTRCLKTQCIATAGLMWLACVWSCATQQNGGLRDVQAKRSIMVLLNAMLAVAGRKCTVQLVVDSTWQSLWPRPPAGFATGSVAVPVPCSDGVLDFSELKHKALHCHNVTAKTWLHYIVKSGMKPNESTVELALFLQKAVSNPKLQPLVAQLVLAMATNLEVVLGKQHHGHFYDRDVPRLRLVCSILLT